MSGATSRVLGLVLDLLFWDSRDGIDDNVILVHCESTGAVFCLPPVWSFKLGSKSLNRVEIPSCTSTELCFLLFSDFLSIYGPCGFSVNIQ
jgi:hypothetical protein